jgi:hypothetical protein
MHRSIVALAASTGIILGAPSSFAMQRGHGATSSARPTATAHGSPTTHGQSTSHGPATKPAGSGSTHANGAAGTHSGSTTSAHGSGSTPGKKTAAGATTTAVSTTTTTTTRTTATGPTALTPVQQKLQRNTNLANKLSSRLGANTDLLAASAGFKNLGQFVAAVNVSNNLGLPFTDVKTRMVTDGMSLGQAIHDLRSTANVETEVRRAEHQADTLITSSTTTTTTTTTATATTTTGTAPARTTTSSDKAKPRSTPRPRANQIDTAR